MWLYSAIFIDVKFIQLSGGVNLSSDLGAIDNNTFWSLITAIHLFAGQPEV